MKTEENGFICYSHIYLYTKRILLHLQQQRKHICLLRFLVFKIILATNIQQKYAGKKINENQHYNLKTRTSF